MAEANGPVALHVEPSTPKPPVADAHIAATAQQEKAMSKRCMMVLDWDDTLFAASTVLRETQRSRMHLPALDEETLRQLAAMESAALAFLKQSLLLGDVVIVTNADQNWVDVSGAIYMPKLLRALKRKAVRVISARRKYEKEMPEGRLWWKSYAFVELIRRDCAPMERVNMVVLGDGEPERRAAHCYASTFPDSCMKTIKLVDQPTVTQLRQQLEFLVQILPRVAAHRGSFDIDLTL